MAVAVNRTMPSRPMARRSQGKRRLGEPLVRRPGLTGAAEGENVSDGNFTRLENVLTQRQVTAEVAVTVKHSLPKQKARQHDENEDSIPQTRHPGELHAEIVHKKKGDTEQCRLGGTISLVYSPR